MCAKHPGQMGDHPGSKSASGVYALLRPLNVSSSPTQNGAASSAPATAWYSSSLAKVTTCSAPWQRAVAC